MRITDDFGRDDPFVVTEEVEKYVIRSSKFNSGRNNKKIIMIKDFRQRWNVRLNIAKKVIEYVLEDKHGD